jgi:hypothetical protein
MPIPSPSARATALTALLAASVVLASCGGSDSETSESAFSPKASLAAVGGTKRTDKPDLVFTVEPRAGQPNLRAVRVELPPVVLVDPISIGRFCSEGELKADDCAGRPRLGVARVTSPSYDAPLEGPVYAVTGSGGLPRLAYVLSGPTDVLLRGRIESAGGTIAAGVDDIPDVPFERFTLRIEGGKQGLLVLSRDVCRGEPAGEGTFTSQDDQVERRQIPLVADCGGA